MNAGFLFGGEFVDGLIELLEQLRNFGVQRAHFLEERNEIARTYSDYLDRGLCPGRELVRHMRSKSCESKIAPGSESLDRLLLSSRLCDHSFDGSRLDQPQRARHRTLLVNDFAFVEALIPRGTLEEERREDEEEDADRDERLRKHEAQQQERIERKPSGDGHYRDQADRDLRRGDDVIDPFAASDSVQ